MGKPKADIGRLVRGILNGGPVDVNSKRESFELWNRGLYGNKLRTWGSYEELLESGHTRPVTMRCRGNGGDGRYLYNVRIKSIPRILASWQYNGVQPDVVFFNETAPDDLLIFQGYLMQSAAGLTLDFSREKAKMRDAMAKPLEQAEGLDLDMMLKRHMTPTSYTDLMDLLKIVQGRSPTTGNVIELGVYDCELGCHPNRNMVIWEVRNY